ncbi:MAG: phage portal protein [Sphingomonas phyllosphaerae]|uniref:phage portal protein n=1 Tax=Sphingomonas phyllosphaerae TaxID=257003 RepID=UPI002FF91789
MTSYTLSARAAAAEARYDASRVVAKAAEGAYRDGPYYLPISGGWLSADVGSNLNFWQMGYDVERGGGTAIVQACVSAYAQTAAMCLGSHWKSRADGGRDRVTNSALSRILLRPNAYQSPSDFILNLTSLLYRRGNAYALAVRNARFEIVELHIMTGACAPLVAVDGSVFYSLSGNEVVERQLAPGALQAVPARDVLHVHLETPRHPLIGETPLTAAMLDLAMSNAMARQAIAFFDRQARPSGTLNTSNSLTADQVKELRERWDEQSRGLNAGGTPILANGLTWTPMTVAAKDTQFAEIMKMSEQNVALAYRVPLQVLGIGDQKFSTTELMMTSWLASGLGFCLNHIEQGFDRLFGLPGGLVEYTEFDTSVLLRSDFSTRVKAWVEGVKGRIFSSDEARADFELGKIDGGDQIFGQQQDIPLGMLDGSQALPAPTEPAPPAPEPPEEPNASRQQLPDLIRSVSDELFHGT